MGFFSRLFKRSSSEQKASVPAPTSHFIYITAPGEVDESFQVSEEDAKRAVAAFDECRFFHFITLFGRSCVINFNLIQTIRIYEQAKLSCSTREIKGVLVHLATNKEPMDIPGDQEQISGFFGQLRTGARFAQIGEWHLNTSSIVAAVASEAYKTQLSQDHPRGLGELGKHVDDEG